MSGHLDEQQLTDYAAGERLDAAEVEAIEGHLFGCDSCAARAAEAASLVTRLRDVFRALPPMLMSDAELEAMTRTHQVQVCNVGAFEQVFATVSPHVDIAVTRIAVDLTGVERLDVKLCAADGAPFIEVSGATFEPGAKFVNVVCDVHIASQNTAFRVQLSGVRGGVPVQLADCTVAQPRA
ncbi:MAG: zf-HC2 domain-containing protein [Myxococcaceae bacterium]|nr:zf-HC2 domain-containing protein [Myxococcaceae bacterium]